MVAMHLAMGMLWAGTSQADVGQPDGAENSPAKKKNRLWFGVGWILCVQLSSLAPPSVAEKAIWRWGKQQGKELARGVLSCWGILKPCMSKL